jgi:sec-independent protein translocase protein TatA
MGRIGMMEIILIALVIVLLFGAKKLPEIGEAIGKAIKEFRKANRELEGGNDNKTSADQDHGKKAS